MVAVATLSLTITEAMLQYVFARAGHGGLGRAEYGVVVGSHSRGGISSDRHATLWTTGCDVHVLLTPLGASGREVFVEFLDVGGHRWRARRYTHSSSPAGSNDTAVLQMCWVRVLFQ
ncbi:hypothetical protein PR003_g31926 [Phytophthora rubi]|uniref:Uncharacterized protein n=1 Tax=Phytophthora rubi TaxID=129364 RepID=A0A6A3GQI2_9STRA|nr:hypothetical protein PR001_g30851 [Phytophthora rubi]KAE9267021.1 hypothetical protein PR003_g31926 [Phytophthora rubi]